MFGFNHCPQRKSLAQLQATWVNNHVRFLPTLTSSVCSTTSCVGRTSWLGFWVWHDFLLGMGFCITWWIYCTTEILIMCQSVRLQCANGVQKSLVMMLLLDGWLSVLCSEQVAICFHMPCILHSISVQYFSLARQLRALGWKLFALCSNYIKDLHGLPSRSWASSRGNNLRNLDQIKCFCKHVQSKLPLATCIFHCENKSFLIATWTCCRAVGELCADMKEVSSVKTWESSIASVHKIWHAEFGYPTSGPLGSIKLYCTICITCNNHCCFSCVVTIF